MIQGTKKDIIKYFMFYSFALFQVFITYVDEYPTENNILLETKKLQSGDHKKVERTLKEKLSIHSYVDDNVDDKYEAFTEFALENFQSVHHKRELDQADDKETMLALLKVESKGYLKRLKSFSKKVYPGMHGSDVKIVQEALDYLGYYDGNIDGIYGPLTKKALILAEEKHDIKLMDKVTEESLVLLEMAKSVEQNSSDVSNNNDLANKEVNKVKSKKQENTEHQTKVTEKTDSDQTNVIQVAHSFIGTPYIWGGESPGGFDCSGFIQYVYQTQDVNIPRTVSDIWDFTHSVNTPSVGDLVFFETYKSGPSHMGIYLGNGDFIHAGESRGVEITKMNNSYWQSRYIGARQIIQ